MRYPMLAAATSMSVLILSITACSRTADEPPLPRIAPSDQALRIPLPQTTLSTPVLPSTRLPEPILPNGADRATSMSGQNKMKIP